MTCGFAFCVFTFDFIMIDKDNIPGHIAIIMDGNGRWAKNKGLTRAQGHREGIKRVEEILSQASDLGIKFVTFYAFSSENWKRPKVEVGILMHLLDIFLGRYVRMMMKNNIRFLTIGRKEPIPERLWKKLLAAKEKTKNNRGLTAVFAFNYGSRQEITDAVKKIADDILEKRLRPEDISEERIGDFLYTKGIPDPDLLIRTSGEQRISNFLLWQLSYAELFFTKTYWPDFKKENLEEAISEYQTRVRRFGGI